MLKNKITYLLLFTGFVFFIVLLFQPYEVFYWEKYVDILFPVGVIGWEQLDLLLIIQGLMLIVIIPVFVLTYAFSWYYRAENRKAKHDPDMTHIPAIEYFWWGIPFIIIAVIGVLTYFESHRLDPYKPIESDKKPLKIQAVALQWKWLFIYPEEKIASVNFLQIPTKRPIHFEITADAPMNSLWIPKLGGQIYAMPKMRTELYLIANEAGDFRGSSANISGKGFAGMHFITRAGSDEEYQKWVESAQKSSHGLGAEEYDKLAAPSENHPVELYQLKDDNLFEQIIMKYMHPQKS